MALSKGQLEFVDEEVKREWPVQYKEAQFCKEKKALYKKIRTEARERLIKEITKNNSMPKNIHGVNVELQHPDIIKAKSIADLEKLDLFSSVNEKDRKAAYQELWSELNPGKKPAVDKEKDHEEK